MADEQEFTRLAEPLRRELFVHCYRMLGSVHDAEDQVQETYLRAWRSYRTFEGRSSLRAWLYQIATNACLRALHKNARRALPSDLSPGSEDPHRALDSGAGGTAWLQPMPSDPADVVAGRDQVRLAVVAALQHLQPRPRAVLILRDVLGMTAVEAAAVLGTSTVAVNSALQRARARLAQLTPDAGDAGGPDDAGRRALLDRYVAAFHNADMAALEAVLLDDVALEMPPYATWFAGRAAVVGFLGTRVLDRPDRIRLVPTTANGQPAFGVYMAERDGTHHAHAIHVLDVRPAGIGRILAFLDPGLFPAFGLPARN